MLVKNPVKVTERELREQGFADRQDENSAG